MRTALWRLAPAAALLLLSVAHSAAAGSVSVGEGVFAYAGCPSPDQIITSISNPLFGDKGKKCNSSDTYLCVSTSAAAVVASYRSLLAAPHPAALPDW